MMAFGLMHFIFSNFVTGLLPVPTWIPGRLSLAYFTSVVLLAAGTGIVANKWAQQSAILLGFMWFLCVLLLHIPKLAANPKNGSAWASAFEALSMCGAALVRLTTKA
jgi:uncharacterized membrane protein